MSANQCGGTIVATSAGHFFTELEKRARSPFNANTHTSFAYSRAHRVSLPRIIILRAPLSFPARTPVFTQCLLLIDFSNKITHKKTLGQRARGGRMTAICMHARTHCAFRPSHALCQIWRESGDAFFRGRSACIARARPN
jgi:hypothetical protein